MSKTYFDLEGYFNAVEKNVLQELEKTAPKKFEQLVLQIAHELMGIVVEKTPKDTGDLQDAWTVGAVYKKGSTYYVDVYNNMEYVDHVEHGHRKRGGKGFVKGAHMMSLSLAEIEQRAPIVAKVWLNDYLDTLKI